MESDGILLERKLPLDLLTAVSAGPVRSGPHFLRLRRSWHGMRRVGWAPTQLVLPDTELGCANFCLEPRESKETVTRAASPARALSPLPARAGARFPLSGWKV